VSQADLAGLIGVPEQLIQRHEAQEYQEASWVRIADTLDALGLELEGLVSQVEAEEQARIIADDPPKRRIGDGISTRRRGWVIAGSASTMASPLSALVVLCDQIHQDRGEESLLGAVWDLAMPARKCRISGAFILEVPRPDGDQRFVLTRS